MALRADRSIGRQIVASWILPWLRAMPAFVAFAAGAVLLPFLIRILKERKPAFAAAGIAFLLLGWLGSRALGVVNWASNIYGGNIVLFLASGLMSSFGFILLFKIVAPHLKLPILAYIGVNSLILMATHLPFPLIKLTEGIYEATLGRIPLANDFLLSHGMLKSLTLLSVLLVIEFPIVWLFTHTRLCILLGRRWDGEGWMKLRI